MDRTEELIRIVHVFHPSFTLKDAQNDNASNNNSPHLRIARRVSINLDGNDVLVKRMEVL